MARLRAAGGCSWGREQTFDTIKRYTLEETYEVLEAIDNRDWQELTGELGDLLLQVLFYAEMAKEESLFSIDDVLDTLSNKLVRRHPHVFGDVKADDANQVLKNWEALKAQERKEKKDKQDKQDKQGGNNHLAATESRHEPLLSGVSAKMPALMEAQKISSKAAHVGFDWQSLDGLFEKLAEETEELRENLREAPAEALESKSSAKLPEELRARLEDEVGDLFFVLVNIARHLSVDPESALRR